MKHRNAQHGLLWIAVFMLPLVSTTPQHITVESFSKDSQLKNGIRNWKQKRFLRQTQYEVISEDDNFVLHAKSHKSASGLFKKIEVATKDYPLISWRWKVTRLPETGSALKKKTDDYGARVYVVFPATFKWNTKTINYIWARTLPKGQTIRNAWLPKNAVMIAAQSGEDALGRWVKEKHNVHEDYKRIFGKKPPTARAIAVMTDTDNTGGSAEAYYDDFVFSRE
ncbi:MAG: DUF3047 domain-containing protein [Planctomycetes bacterium]|nr:DUF3047 domain-containing protein [Planctomycetota bacterium]